MVSEKKRTGICAPFSFPTLTLLSSLDMTTMLPFFVLSLLLVLPNVMIASNVVSSKQNGTTTSSAKWNPPDLTRINKNLVHLSAKIVKRNAEKESEFVKKGKSNADYINWVMYKQCDSQWGSYQIGSCDETICSVGCAMSSVSMMLATKGAAVDPHSLNQYLTDNGGYADGCNIIWAYADAFGVTSFQGKETADEAAICSGLNQGHGIIANVNNGGHWVLLTGCLGNGVFTVNDPGFKKDTYTFDEISVEAVYH